ncbi:MAG TPA: hypothetical protein VJ732_05925 [Bryobacteraceae bacterium]|nr:hypothetical protein [Bryobacteraceae bacterium]
MAQETSLRRTLFPPWVWIVIAIILAIALILFFTGWPISRNAAGLLGPRNPGNPVPGAGTPTGQLVGAGVPNNAWIVNLDPRTAISRAGSPVRVNEAFIKQQAGENAFWIGPQGNTGGNQEPERWFLVVDSGASGTAQTPMHPGEVVRLSGSLEQIPPQAAHLWKLNSASAARLSRQEVYIRADRIAPAAQP